MAMDDRPMPHARVLHYDDEVLGMLDFPSRRLTITRGLGSGLARRPGDPATTVWAVGDRGPNIKAQDAVDVLGVHGLHPHRLADGAKLMPMPGVGPAISELRIQDDRVTLVRTLKLRGRSGRPISGLPTPGGPNTVVEPAVTLDGDVLAPDPSGVDSEGIAAMPDGGFWIADEYGPSLLRVASDGSVTMRWVSRGSESLFARAEYPVEGILPPIAARRRLNRGFEAIGVTDDGTRLYLMFQSPLAHPDADAFRHARHVRIWTLDTATGAVIAQHVYPLDPPKSFRRDTAMGDVDRSDIKVSELTVVAPDRLLVLERCSRTTKLYRIDLATSPPVDPVHLDDATRPTLEQLSADGKLDHHVPVVTKTLVLNTDDLPQVDADLEGLVLLSPRTLLLVNDNDFGVAGVATRFWRIELSHDVA